MRGKYGFVKVIAGRNSSCIGYYKTDTRVIPKWFDEICRKCDDCRTDARCAVHEELVKKCDRAVIYFGGVDGNEPTRIEYKNIIPALITSGEQWLRRNPDLERIINE